MLTINTTPQPKHHAVLQRLADLNAQAVEFVFSVIVTVGLILTCFAIAPLLVGAHAWARCIKRR